MGRLARNYLLESYSGFVRKLWRHSASKLRLLALHWKLATECCPVAVSFQFSSFAELADGRTGRQRSSFNFGEQNWRARSCEWRRTSKRFPAALNRKGRLCGFTVLMSTLTTGSYCVYWKCNEFLTRQSRPKAHASFRKDINLGF